MKKATFKQKLRYYFENQLSTGPISLIKWLAIVSLVIILFLGLVILIFGIKGAPDADGPLGFFEGAWQSLMATLDSGTMGGDEGWPFRIVRFVATLTGLFVISVLIGAIGAAIDGAIEEIRKGRSDVLEDNHTLILGWSEKIFSIVSEIVIANENQHKPSIVILADRDKVEMEDDIRAKVEDTKNTKVIVRSGSPLDATDLTVVNPNGARSIIVLSPEESENPDTHVIKTVLALTNGKKRKKEAFNIVAEIKDENNMEAAELVGNEEAVYIMSGDLISRITAQTCRQSGLSVVYSDLMQFEGDELYFQEEPSLVEKTFKNALFAYETSSVIGIFTKNEEVLINPPLETLINKGDQVIAISEDDDTVVVSGKTSFPVDSSVIIHEMNDDQQVEKTLILGWNARGIRIIEELDNYVASGSSIVILAEGNEIEHDVKVLPGKLNNQNIQFVSGSITDKATLESIKPGEFDHIILLSYTHFDNIQESDAQTLICLLHLRNMSEKSGKDFSIVSEMLDIRNRELGEVANADDFIVSDNLISLMLSQISENKDLKAVYDVLFESEGSEIYLKPIERYAKTDMDVNIYTLLESATQINELVIGYRIEAEAKDSDKNFGVYMNPKKDKIVRFTPGDKIIVLAED